MSNLPTLSNYEEWLINHLEGLLDARETALLMTFLEEYPAIKAEFELLQGNEMVLESAMEAEDFSFLKKPEQGALTAQEEHQLVALLEGDLPKDEKEFWQQQVKENAHLTQAYALLEKTKLPAEVLVFENKNSLKRKQGLLISLYFQRAGAIAAAMLLLGFGTWLLLKNGEVSTTQTALVPSVKQLVEKNQTLANNGNLMKRVEPNQTQKIEEASAIRYAKVDEVLVEQIEPKAAKPIEQQVSVPAKLGPPLIAFDFIQKNAQLAQMANQDKKYLSITEWALQKIKRNIPAQAIAAVDTISRGGATNLAIGLLSKTTGITMETSSQENDPRKRVALMSRYFSYERISYQKQ